jgi:hypothetical protein
VNDTLDQVVVCAYDPNDKQSDPAGLGTQGYIDPELPYLDYTIRFQNTGNDTALTVIIRDQLDTNLVWSSFEKLASSHPAEAVIGLNGEAVFTFEDIYLPDSLTNEIASHGFIKYRIYLQPGLPLGTSIYNTASIYFDSNPAVITNTKVNTIPNCAQMTETINYVNSLCENNDLELSADFPNLHFDWEVAGSAGNGSAVLWHADTTGLFDLHLSVSNDFCLIDTTIAVTVHVSPAFEPGTTIPDELCANDAAIALPAFAPLTGTYTGPGVSGMNFNPQAAGIGTHQILYHITDNEGCSAIDSIEMIVHTIPVATISPDIPQTLCSDAEMIDLPATVDGVYSGTGITGTTFDPQIAGVGEHFIYYSVTNSNSCQSTDSVTINVTAIPAIVLSSDLPDTLCITTTELLLPPSEPASGTYSGTGISNGIIYPATAGEGEHLVYYTFTTADGCAGTDSAVIVIDSCNALGITEVPGFNVTISPNPFAEYTVLEFNGDLEAGYNLKVTDVTGRELMVLKNLQGSKLVLHREQLAAGVLIVTISNALQQPVYLGRLIAE